MKELKDRFPDWAQLFLAVLVLSGGMLATYVANEVRRETIAAMVSKHESEIVELKSHVRDVPVIYERMNQLYVQNERQMIVFESLAESVNKLSINVARLDERLKAVEN